MIISISKPIRRYEQIDIMYVELLTCIKIRMMKIQKFKNKQLNLPLQLKFGHHNLYNTILNQQIENNIRTSIYNK